MVKNVTRFFRSYVMFFAQKRITRASAALSYYFTMTFFPLIICLYTMLGNNYEKALRALSFADRFMAAETARSLEEFLRYVAANNSTAMMIAGLAILITSASAAVRSLEATIGEMQGGQRFQGLMYFVFSVVLSLLLLATTYFAILVIFTGEEFMIWLNGIVPSVDISGTWSWLRFVLLGGIEFVIIWGVYEVSKRRIDKYSTFPGAVFSTVGLVGVSYVFSIFIGASVRYPLVYGSLASVILLMFWLYICCIVIYCGAALNIVLRDMKKYRTQY